MKIYMFKSRNKDNKDIPGFHERTKAFLAHDDFDPEEAFISFANKGQNGETCRMYVSINEVDKERVQKHLAADLILNPCDLTKVENKVVSLAMKYKTTKKWLFDVDTTNRGKLEAFLAEVEKHDVSYTCHKTKNGYAVVTEHGFDTRELTRRFPFVENKKDGLLFVKYATVRHLGD